MNTQERFYSLDAVRAFALLAGIVLHTTMSFLPGFREYHWPISDSSTSLSLAIVFFVIHNFRISVFFLIAGFFGRQLLLRLGPSGFIKNRLRRIALPLVVFYIVVTPLVIVALVGGATQLHFKGPPTMPPPAPQRGLPWGHLWFLYLLLVVYAMALAMRAGLVRLDTKATLRNFFDRLLHDAMAKRLAPVLLALPLGATLYFTPWWLLGQGIPTPMMGFVPNVPSLIAFGGAFVVGWFLHRQKTLLELLRRDWLLYLTAAVVLSGLSLTIIGARPRFEFFQLPPTLRLSYTASYTIAIWCWAFGLIGAAMRFLSSANTVWRYLADASYWMYLVHLPVVWLLQAWMLKWPLHWAAKFTLILCITSAVLLTTYHFAVRSTFIGRFLNGRKYGRSGTLTLSEAKAE